MDKLASTLMDSDDKQVENLLVRLRNNSNRNNSTGSGALAQDIDDEGAELLALITSAIHDEYPQYTLAQIWQAVSYSEFSGTLVRLEDALNLVPLLVACSDPVAGEISSFLARSANGKEVLIATQEAIERLIRDIQSDQTEETDNQDARRRPAAPFAQLGRILDLYSSSIPRSRFRMKTPAETIRSLLPQLETAIALAVPSFSNPEGRTMICLVSRFVLELMAWVKQKSKENGKGDLLDTESIAVVRSLLLSAIVSLSSHIGSQLAQREFELSSRRLVVRSAVDGNYQEGDNVMKEAVLAALGTGYSNSQELAEERSLGALVLLAHNNPQSIPSNKLLSILLPVLITSIQAHIALDETLYILLVALLRRDRPNALLDPDLPPPLCAVLAPLACVHPDPSVRHLVFRILSALLAASPPLQRMHLLRDLLAEDECPFPQMRVAAIGLLKEAALEALGPDSLANDPPNSNPFASPALLQTFGAIVLRPDPPDLFTTLPTLAVFLDTQEPRRLVESLAFYYIILMRDKTNVTGIRDPSLLNGVENGLLIPLRTALEGWAQSRKNGEDVHASMPLVALETALDRVDEARERLGLVA